LHVPAAAVRTLNSIPIMLSQAESLLEGFAAIIADVIVHGHEHLPANSPQILILLLASQSCDYFFSEN
jgi:hypothetical protein